MADEQALAVLERVKSTTCNLLTELRAGGLVGSALSVEVGAPQGEGVPVLVELQRCESTAQVQPAQPHVRRLRDRHRTTHALIAARFDHKTSMP